MLLLLLPPLPHRRLQERSWACGMMGILLLLQPALAVELLLLLLSLLLLPLVPTVPLQSLSLSLRLLPPPLGFLKPCATRVRASTVSRSLGSPLLLLPSLLLL